MGITDLLLLGKEADLGSERGVSCDGALPSPSDPDLVERANQARSSLGDRAMILGHHYQRDEVIAYADIRGDSFKLAQAAADNPNAEFIFFCGVHFMAESADILTTQNQKVILPDLAAGCSMADMATAAQVEDCWQELEKLGVAKKTIPITYMNSSAAIKAFTGKNNGAVCTSSNAMRAMKWAFEKGEKVLFLPDQHLGRNTAVLSLGLKLEDCVIWNPWKPSGGLSEAQIKMARENPDKEVVFLDKTVCYCSTMNRIDLPHLVWAMEALVAGRVVNQIKVDEQVALQAKVALERMLALP